MRPNEDSARKGVLLMFVETGIALFLVVWYFVGMFDLFDSVLQIGQQTSMVIRTVAIAIFIVTAVDAVRRWMKWQPPTIRPKGGS